MTAAGGAAVAGGRLTFVGHGDVDHLDPGCANYTASAVLLRAYARQLVTYPSTNDVERAGTLVCDMAGELPGRANGRISDDGLTYTFTIADGVLWDTAPPRQVTAQDLVRGIKRLGNPAAPCPLLRYFTSSVKGLGEFCDGFRRVRPNPRAIAAYLEGNDVKGLRAADERTVVFELEQPTPDFLDILTLPFASAVPVEYLGMLPGGAELDGHIISNGPYRVTRYEPGARIVLERNPAWCPGTDCVRRGYVDAIHVRQGYGQDEACDLVASGAADLLWDVPPPTSALPGLAGDERLEVVAHGMLNPCLLINMASPNAGRATSKLGVRQALQYAVDKRAVAEIYGGAEFNTVTSQLLPPWNPAYRPVDLYPTADGAGDPHEARRLLAAAGYPDGLTLRMIFRDAGNHPRVARAVRAALARAGIVVELRPVSQTAFYPEYLEVAARARAGDWDITTQGWLPDWQGNNARSYLQPHFDSSGIALDDDTWGVVYGFYNSPVTNRLIAEATTARDAQQASELFHRAELQVMRDAAVVPLLFQRSPTMRAQRVGGFTGFPCHLGDPTNMWIARRA